MKTTIMLECKQCGKWWRTTNQYRTIPVGCDHVKVVHVCQACKKVYDSDEREEAERCCELDAEDNKTLL